jgi:hypothetical protein
VLVNNVGGLFPTHVTTSNGLEATLALNFVAPAALTGRLAAAPAARCVNVVSSAFAMLRGDPFADPPSRYVGIDAYARAKLLTVLWTCQLAADPTRAPKPSLAGVFCANPGMAWTPNVQQLTRQAVPAWRLVWPLVRWMQRRTSPAHSARSPLYAATAPLEALTTGPYVDDKGRVRPIPEQLVGGDGPRRAQQLAQRLIDRAACPIRMSPPGHTVDTLAVVPGRSATPPPETHSAGSGRAGAPSASCVLFGCPSIGKEQR